MQSQVGSVFFRYLFTVGALSTTLFLTACGGSDSDANVNSGLVGFWKQTGTCYNDPDANGKTCDASSESDSHIQIDPSGNVTDIEGDMPAGGCRVTGTQVNCGGTVATIEIINPNEFVIHFAFEKTKIETTFERITASEYAQKKQEHRNKLTPIKNAIKSLYGKNLVLDKIVYATTDKATGETSSYETLAADIPEEEEDYTDDKGNKYRNINPKVVRFVDAKKLVINNKYTTIYDVDVYKSKTQIWTSLTLMNGKIDENAFSMLGDTIQVDGDQVQIIEISESVDEEGNETTIYTETKHYHIQ